MHRPIRLILAALVAGLPAALLVLWRRQHGGFDSPIDTFKTSAAAVVLLVVAGVAVTIFVVTPARVRQWLPAFLRDHRRMAGILFGITATALLVGLLELTFLAINSRRTEVKKAGLRFQVDPDLGYSLVPGDDSVAVAKFSDEVIFRAHYSVDRFGHRKTTGAPASAPHAVVFFGCSFTFGEGLTDEQTLASQYARHIHDEIPVNFGVPGHGPNHILARLQDAKPLSIPECPGPPVGVYLYMDAHVDRCIGGMFVVNLYGGEAPYYDYRGGNLVRIGNFLHDRPVTAISYWILGKSQILQHFGFNWPPAGLASSIALTADVIIQCAAEFKRRTGSSQFVMVVYPGCRFGRGVASRVRDAGMRVLDYTDLFDPDAPGYSFPHDGHPAPPAIERLAQQLAQDLPRR